MKLLYFDMIYKKGHKIFDKCVINNLALLGDVDVVEPNNWYGTETNKVFDVGVLEKDGNRSRCHFFWVGYNNLINAIKLIKQNKYDVIVCGECELLSFFLYTILVPQKCLNRTIVIHHQDIDTMIGRRILNRIRRQLFRIRKNRYYHCSLEPFIADSLVIDFDVDDNRVLCWRYPVSDRTMKKERDLDCVGISGSNDETFIQALINKEIEKKVVKNEGLRVVLKSKEYEFDDGYLKVIKGWLKEDEYDDYYSRARSVLVPFPKTFINRISSTVCDAISRKIPVIGTDIPLMRYYTQKYSNCFSIVSIESFCSSVKRIGSKNEIQDKEFELFMKDHSTDSIVWTMKNDIYRIGFGDDR